MREVNRLSEEDLQEWEPLFRQPKKYKKLDYLICKTKFLIEMKFEIGGFIANIYKI